MPQRVKVHTYATPYTPNLFYMSANNQTLEGLTLSLVGGAAELNVGSGLIGVLAGGTSIEHKILTLDQGWFGSSHDLFWTGNLHLPDDCYLFGYVITDAARDIRLSALLWDFEPPKLREKPGVA